MKITTRYVLMEYLRLYSLTALTLLSVFIIVSLFEVLADAIEYHAGTVLIARYLIMKLPQAVYFMSPLIVLTSSILCIGVLSKSNELVAMKSAGAGIARITAPIFFVSALTSIFMLLLGEVILPYSNIEMKRIYREEIKKKAPSGIQQKDNFWYRTDDGSILKIGVVSEDGTTLRNVTLLGFSNNRLSLRIDSGSVVWRKERWEAEDSWIRVFKGNGEFVTRHNDITTLQISEKPSDFSVITKSPDKMSYRELGNYITRIKKEGMDPTKYIVNMKSKISFPFICIVMAFISIPFSLRSTERQGGVTIGISIGACTGFIAWFVYSTGISLGRSGKIPVFWSVWGAEIIFVVLGVLLTLSSRR